MSLQPIPFQKFLKTNEKDLRKHWETLRNMKVRKVSGSILYGEDSIEEIKTYLSKYTNSKDPRLLKTRFDTAAQYYKFFPKIPDYRELLKETAFFPTEQEFSALVVSLFLNLQKEKISAILPYGKLTECSIDDECELRKIDPNTKAELWGFLTEEKQFNKISFEAFFEKYKSSIEREWEHCRLRKVQTVTSMLFFSKASCWDLAKSLSKYHSKELFKSPLERAKYVWRKLVKNETIEPDELKEKTGFVPTEQEFAFNLTSLFLSNKQKTVSLERASLTVSLGRASLLLPFGKTTKKWIKRECLIRKLDATDESALWEFLEKNNGLHRLTQKRKECE